MAVTASSPACAQAINTRTPMRASTITALILAAALVIHAPALLAATAALVAWALTTPLVTASLLLAVLIWRATRATVKAMVIVR